tara:strand:- start:1754 stop:2134 length:381 start_codon:yes stop_codon:yes gene_type:complete
MATKSEDATEWPMRRSTKQKQIQAAALVIGGEQGMRLEAREGRTLGGLWGVPYAEGKVEIQQLLNGREVKEIGQLRHDFSHKKLHVTVYSANPSVSDELREPESVPLSTLDRKILELFKVHQSEES